MRCQRAHRRPPGAPLLQDNTDTGSLEHKNLHYLIKHNLCFPCKITMLQLCKVFSPNMIFPLLSKSFLQVGFLATSAAEIVLGFLVTYKRSWFELSPRDFLPWTQIFMQAKTNRRVFFLSKSNNFRVYTHSTPPFVLIILDIKSRRKGSASMRRLLTRGTCIILVDKPARKRPLARPRCRWENVSSRREMGA